jgi:5-methylcytosine-specific restriction endonuclease McrA
MMRLEFSAKTRDQAAKRANGKCEYCHLPFRGRAEFHHILDAAYGGQATLANCLVVCKTPCHKTLTAKQAGPRAKADRQRRAHIGAKAAPKQIIQSAGFPKAGKPKIEKLPVPPPRSLYESTR